MLFSLVRLLVVADIAAKISPKPNEWQNSMPLAPIQIIGQKKLPNGNRRCRKRTRDNIKKCFLLIISNLCVSCLLPQWNYQMVSNQSK